MLRRVPLMVSLCGMLLSACGGPGNFDGTVGGNSLSVKSALFYTQPFGAAGVGGSAVGLALTDQADACERLKANRLAPNSAGVGFGLGVTAGGLNITASLTTGAYRLFSLLDVVSPPPNGTRMMIGGFENYDANCAGTLGSTQGLITAGSLQVDAFQAGSDGYLKGTFDLSFGVDTAQGSFNAVFCDFVPTGNQPAPTCS
ncbi:MAG: hypothetical protein ACKVPX_00285 [Myxococcaceae bacterium]